MSSIMPDDERSDGRTSRAGQSSNTVAAARGGATQGSRRGAPNRRGRRNDRAARPPSTTIEVDQQLSDRSSVNSDQRSDRSHQDTSLTEEVRQLRLLVSELQAQLAEANATHAQPVYRSVEREADDIRRSSTRGPTSPSSDQRRFTIKLPNPAPLTDGISPTFEDWEILVSNKLEVNEWQFPDERTKFAWLVSLTAGTAARTLAPYISPSNPKPFTTTKEVLDLLRRSLSDPDQTNSAKHELRELQMATNEEFYSFCSTFVQLASTAKVPLSEWKFELNERLTTNLRLHVLQKYVDDAVDFDKFRTHCSTIHQQLVNLDRAKRRNARTVTTVPPRLASDQTPIQAAQRSTTPVAPPTRNSPAPVIPRATSLRPSATATAPLATASSDQVCYACGRKGHYAKECNTKPPSGAVHLIDPEGVERSTPESESENDSA